MRKAPNIALLALGLVFVAVPVLACSAHGSNAAAQINNWLGGDAANNTIGGSDTQQDGAQYSPFVTVTGGEDDNNGGGSFARDHYWVEITGPNGYSQKLTATTNAGRTQVTITDKHGHQLNTITIDDGTELEMFLRDTAIAIIRTLMPDAKAADYVG
jgi:hypothetical protein